MFIIKCRLTSKRWIYFTFLDLLDIRNLFAEIKCNNENEWFGLKNLQLIWLHHQQRKMSKHVKYLNCQIAETQKSFKSISKRITYTADMPAMSNMSPPQEYSFVQLTFQRFCRHNPIAEGQWQGKQRGSSWLLRWLQSMFGEPTPGTTFNTMITNTWNNF